MSRNRSPKMFYSVRIYYFTFIHLADVFIQIKSEFNPYNSLTNMCDRTAPI